MVVDHTVEVGNPPDAPQLRPAVERVARRAGGRRGRSLPTAATSTPGRPSDARCEVERQRGIRELVKWRTGSEGRISCLKRDFGRAPARIDGIDGARTWCGHGVFNHSPIKIAALID